MPREMLKVDIVGIDGSLYICASVLGAGYSYLNHLPSWC